MKRRTDAPARVVSAHGWHSRADVVAALRHLESEPLPAIRPATLDAPGVRRAFQCAYAAHPVICAAREWGLAERGGRSDVSSEVTRALTYVSVHAMECYFRERSVDAVETPDDDELAPF